jgi:membrane protease YdiL (CAAX protease family)
MDPSATRGASGIQIAFFVFAVLILFAASDRFVFDHWQWANDSGFPVGRTMMFLSAGAILLGFPGLRRLCVGLLAAEVPKTKRKEVVAVTALLVLMAFAAVGALALWWWSSGGEPALARHMGQSKHPSDEWQQALSLNGVVSTFVLAGILAPIVEELVFRGMLYRAWALRWGWFPGALATSLVFAVFHSGMVSQFFGSLLFVSLLRRTGSLRACIFSHAAFNILVWYPLMGHFLFPAGRSTGEISFWVPHLICLPIALIAVPTYLWMARETGR